MTLSAGTVLAAHAASNVTSVATTGYTSITGSGIVVVLETQGGTHSVADNKSNTYIQIGSTQTYNFANRAASAWYCPVITGGAGTIVTGSATSAYAADMTIYVAQVNTTIGNGILLDVSSVANSATLVTAPITTQYANEVLFAFFCGASTSNPATHTVSGSITPIIGASDITNGASSLDSTGCMARRQVSSTQSALTSTFTELGNSGGSMVMFALGFYEAGIPIAWIT